MGSVGVSHLPKTLPFDLLVFPSSFSKQRSQKVNLLFLGPLGKWGLVWGIWTWLREQPWTISGRPCACSWSGHFRGPFATRRANHAHIKDAYVDIYIHIFHTSITRLFSARVGIGSFKKTGRFEDPGLGTQLSDCCVSLLDGTNLRRKTGGETRRKPPVLASPKRKRGAQVEDGLGAPTELAPTLLGGSQACQLRFF